MKVISVVGEKGGVGKSTVASNIAWVLANEGKTTILFDMDKSAALTRALGFDPKTVFPSVKDLLLNERNPDEVVIKMPKEVGYSFIPANMNLVEAEHDKRVTSNNYSVDDMMESVMLTFKELDYVILDAPGSLDTITKQCLLASDETIIVTELAEMGYGPFEHTVEFVESLKNLGADLKMNKIVGNRWSRSNHTIEITNRAIKQYPECDIFIINDQVKVKDSIYALEKCIAGEQPGSQQGRKFHKIGTMIIEQDSSEGDNDSDMEMEGLING